MPEYDVTELVDIIMEQVMYPAIDEEVRETRFKLDDRMWKRIKANCRRLAKTKKIVVEIREKH